MKIRFVFLVVLLTVIIGYVLACTTSCTVVGDSPMERRHRQGLPEDVNNP